MPKESKNMSGNVNIPPGSLIHVGERWSEEVEIIYRRYDREEFEELRLDGVDEFINDKSRKVKWLNIIGLHDTMLIDELCKGLNIHPLVTEDILNTGQGVKFENYEDYLFVNTKLVFLNSQGELEREQISFVLFEDRLISFQEIQSSLFNPLIKRLLEGTYIRKNGTDDLFYGLLDAIVDNYFILMEDIGDKIDEVEDELLSDPSKNILEKIYNLKRELIYIRNSLWPMRNIVGRLSKNDFALIDERTSYYLRDVYENTVQAIDIVETYREICSGMLDTYLSTIGNKTNEVMKILTIFSTIFIPLTFLAGVYGMNFKYLPELDWKYGYLSFWLISIITIGIMIRFFRKKGWL